MRLYAALVIIGAYPLLFGQTNAKQAVPTSAKQDTWQRSKECSAQAEKVVTERNLMTAKYGSVIAQWENHYSTKYNRCYLRALYIAGKEQVKGGPLTTTLLIDAFERSVLAEFAFGETLLAGVCRNDAKPQECEEGARAIYKSVCAIENEQIECAKSEAFISEHMKN